MSDEKLWEEKSFTSSNRLPNEWDKTVEMLRKTAETMLGVTFGKRKRDRETWWWNEEVQKKA